MTEDISVWVQIIGNFGFPVGVTLYLLIRFEKKIDVLSDTINKLIDVIRSNRTGGK
ncbi:YvrJ family protein [Paenibacillus sp. P46E]|uniref:YvrJ family protein n=1 Tax=Paenibacillus sp. P46E TaxID=1349436 RepID=UPI0009391676|nr:YvrJ family protein [Paenibacillus sp. P46E]OKP96767.1 ribonuclease Z [Paenibacillus sp. P46E]